MTVTLHTILTALTTLLTPIHVEFALDHFQAKLFDLATMNKDSQRVLRRFIDAVATECVANPGVRFLKDCVSIPLDRIWSTTWCGIATMRNVTAWLQRSMQETDLHPCTVMSSIDHPSISSQITQSPVLATSTSYTTVTGIPASAVAPASPGTSGATLTEGLIKLAKCHTTTGNRSSHIYVQDDDVSFKYELANTSGDTLFDIRVYPTRSIEGVEPRQ